MILNTQKKQKLENKDLLYVHSIFKTIQGEGPFAGYPAIFIRLAGCNLECPLCDTEYTGSDVRLMSVSDIEKAILNLGENLPSLIVITGGEPFRQDFSKLANSLVNNHFKIQVETNGTIYRENFPYSLVTLVCSPKTAHINKKLQSIIEYYKYVGQANKLNLVDGLPVSVLDNKIRVQVARPPDRSTFSSYIVYLQPADEQDDNKNQMNIDAVVGSCKQFNHVLCLQLHKIIGVE